MTTPTTNVAAALDRLALQFKNQPNIAGVITALAQQADTAETALQQVGTINQIRASSGVQLDALGVILGEPRRGYDDSTYQLHLLARIWLNRSNGTPENIYGMFQFLTPGYSLWIRDYPPGSFILYLGTTIPPASADYLNGLLQQAKPAGVRASLNYLNAPAASSFTFDGGSGVGFENGTWASAIG